MGSRGSNQLFFWAEAFGGYAILSNSGGFLNYQKQYYITQNPSFSISGDFPRQGSPVLGVSAHLGSSLSLPLIKFVSAGFSFTGLERKLVHSVDFTNTSFPYRNKISIRDCFSGSYLGSEFQFRFGSRVYGLLGVRNDFLLSGLRQRSVRLEGDSVQNGSTTELLESWNLKNSSLVRQFSWGWQLGIGYNPVPMLGLRLGCLFSGPFFSEGPDFRTQQYYFTACFNFIK